MAGWNVPSGDISDSVVFEDEIWTAFNYFFSDSCRKNTTYKYGFLKSSLIICFLSNQLVEDWN